MQVEQILRLSTVADARQQAPAPSEMHSPPVLAAGPSGARVCAQGSSPDTHFGMGMAQAYSAGTYLTTPNASNEPMYRTVSASTVSGSGSVEVYHRQLSAEVSSAAQVRPFLARTLLNQHASTGLPRCRQRCAALIRRACGSACLVKV